MLLLSGIDSCGDHILHLEVIEQASNILVKSNQSLYLTYKEVGELNQKGKKLLTNKIMETDDSVTHVSVI